MKLPPLHPISTNRRDLGIKLHHVIIFGVLFVGALLYIGSRNGAIAWPAALQQQSSLLNVEVQAPNQIAQLMVKLEAMAAKAASLEAELQAVRAGQPPAAGQPAAAAQRAAVDPEVAKCMRLGKEYASKLKDPGDFSDRYNQTFLSPLTTTLDGEFMRMAIAVGTDKVTTHSYHYAYTRFLAHARFQPNLHILEIGLGCNMGYGPGASLKLWRAYLPCAKISFVEYDKECADKWKDYIENEGGGKLYIGSQDNVSLLAEIVADSKASGGFDMIVDDGSHNPNHIIVSLDNLWAGVKPGGVYIIEDLHDHFGQERDWDTMAPPTLVVPLFQRLINTINCQSYIFGAYGPTFQEWCRKEQKSQYRDVARVDCMRELCGIVKQLPLSYVT